MTVVDSVRLAIDGSGRALAMWSGLGDQTRDYAGFVAWARSTPRGQWSRRRDVTQRHIGEWGGLVDVSMNGDGLAVAAWLEITGGGERSRLWAARYRGDGTWSAPRRVARGDWWDVSPWMDDAGVAHLVADRGAIWAFSQGPGAAWTGTALNSGYLLDANGAGSRMAMVFYRKHALQSRILDVR
jgi:hypothetical protein